MGGNDLGPEPTGWELMRGLDEVKKSIEKIGERVVPLELYNADKQGNAERHQRAEARLTELEKGNVETDKLRRQQRLTISLAILAPILSAALALLVKVVVP